MGFALKKLVSAVLMPFPLAIILLCIGFILIFYRKRLAIICQAIAIALLLLISFQPFANWAVLQLESPYSTLDIEKPYEVIVVLGNCHKEDEHRALHTQFCGTGLYRLTESVRLWEANKDTEVFVSGYGGENETPYAILARDFMLENGVNKDKIRVFETPKDTRQEAEKMAPYLKGKSFALVTSANHIRRSILWFEYYGLKPLPAPAHFFSSTSTQEQNFSVNALIKVQAAWYETLGILWAKLIIALSPPDLCTHNH